MKRQKFNPHAGSAPGRPGRILAFESHLTPAAEAALRRWRECRDDEALAGWRRLVKREPRNLHSLYLAARAFRERFHMADAMAVMGRIRRLAPGAAAVHHTLGQLHREMARLDLARDHFARATRCRDADPASFVNYAELLERAHQLDEARELLDRADLRHHPRATLLRARILARGGDSSAAEQALADLADSLPDTDELAAEALGELALLRDRAGDHDGAFAAILRAKAGQLDRCAPEFAAACHVTQRFAEFVDSVTPDDFKRWASAAPAAEEAPAPALLSGFPRSGTTLLEQILDAHPGIVSSEEIDIIACETFPAMHGSLAATAPIQDVLDAQDPAGLARHRLHYWETLAALGTPFAGAAVHIDKNPSYNLLIPVFLRLFPGAKLIIALRDPRDVLVSCFLRYLPLNPVSVTFLTPASTVSRYMLDMTAWLRFSEMIDNPWREVRYEDLIEDFPGQAHGVCETLGVPWDPAVLGYRETLAGKSVSSPTYADVTRPIHRGAIGRWRCYEKHLGEHFDALAPFLEAFGYTD